MVYIRQHQSSPLSTSDIENYVKDIGDHRFVDSKSQSTPGPLKYKDKVCVISISQHIFPSLFIIFFWCGFTKELQSSSSNFPLILEINFELSLFIAYCSCV